MCALGSSVPLLKLGRQKGAVRTAGIRARIEGPSTPRLGGAELETQNLRRRPPGRPNEAENGSPDPDLAGLVGASGSRAPVLCPAAQTGIDCRLRRNRDVEKQPRRQPAAGPASGERKQPGGEGVAWRGRLVAASGPRQPEEEAKSKTPFLPRDKRAPARSPPQAWETGSQAPSDPQSIPVSRLGQGMLGERGEGRGERHLPQAEAGRPSPTCAALSKTKLKLPKFSTGEFKKFPTPLSFHF